MRFETSENIAFAEAKDRYACSLVIISNGAPPGKASGYRPEI
jgi:hypothetical protein